MIRCNKNNHFAHEQGSAAVKHIKKQRITKRFPSGLLISNPLFETFLQSHFGKRKYLEVCIGGIDIFDTPVPHVVPVRRNIMTEFSGRTETFYLRLLRKKSFFTF